MPQMNADGLTGAVGAGILLTLIDSAKSRRAEDLGLLPRRDLPERNRAASRLEELLPYNWKPVTKVG